MRVVFLGTYNESEVLTGPEKVAKRVFDEYCKTDPAVFVEYYQDGRNHSIFKKIFGKKIIRNESNSKIIRAGIIPFILFLIRYRPQIIHIITFERFAKLVFSLKGFLNFKVIFNLHGIVYYENTELNIVGEKLTVKNHKAEEAFINKSDALLYLSDFYIDIGKKYYEIDESKLIKIKNGVDEVFSHSGSTWSANEKLKIVFSGDIKRKDKGFEFLKKALSALNQNIDLYIVGSKVYDLNIKDNIKIHFAGFLNAKELSEFYQDKDIFISASIYDTFSIAAAEAMCTGLVTIVTTTTGIAQYIEDGVNGFKVEYGDVGKLNEILLMLNSDQILWEKIIIEGQKIYEMMKWPKIVKSYRSIYSNLIS